MDYWIRRRKKGFVVVERNRETRKCASVKHDGLRAVNRELKAGRISEHTARKMIEEIIANLRPKKIRVFHSENAALLNKYWNEVYSLRDLVAPESAYNRLARGLAALDKVSIHVADKQTIYRMIKDAPNQRDLAAVLNQFLKYLGRPFSIPLNRPKRPKVRYLTWEQFKALRPHLDPLLQHLYTGLFCSGCRMGEFFAISHPPRNRRIFVEEQLTRKLELTDTKTGEARQVPLILEGPEAIRRWLSYPEEERCSLRHIRGEELKDACRKAKLPPIKQHDLRHCYAVYLAEQGISVGLIAKCLGNSQAVCERYYSGFVLTDEGVDTVLASLKKI